MRGVPVVLRDYPKMRRGNGESCGRRLVLRSLPSPLVPLLRFPHSKTLRYPDRRSTSRTDEAHHRRACLVVPSGTAPPRRSGPSRFGRTVTSSSEREDAQETPLGLFDAPLTYSVRDRSANINALVAEASATSDVAGYRLASWPRVRSRAFSRSVCRPSPATRDHLVHRVSSDARCETGTVPPVPLVMNCFRT